ncbi:Cyclic pyranopterin monophosphate synthase accessory protein [Ceratocystis platani]|uniref:GTP 3',8-cyclase n=1 Tax=Ceratocystis fimbriata f. sp. platani TaxID=88771 RepID=A0A0F8B348_CERFI|nr:Cyclic pyranopterin monophosphate synthase accessory protein [Ceratocystis platani]
MNRFASLNRSLSSSSRYGKRNHSLALLPLALSHDYVSALRESKCASWHYYHTNTSKGIQPQITPPPPDGLAKGHGSPAVSREDQPGAEGLPVAPAGSLSTPHSRNRDRIKEAKPFSDFLTDTFNRQHDYLRISVTERCNLRCLYCMPEAGVPLSPPRNILTTPEIVLLSSLFVSQGVTKIRLTGGEPTVRSDIVPLMQQIGALRSRGLRELCITTNGISLHRKLDAMVDAGLTGINLSLDTLDPLQFQIMTRRKGFDAVQRSIDRVLAINHASQQETGMPKLKLKINCVVIRGVNDREILPFVELTRSHNLEVRFIEYMPFDGNRWNKAKMLSYADMLDIIRRVHPDVHAVRGHANDTSKTWQVPGHVGRLGFITSMTHNFCGSCNRLRITSDGNLKVCLFGNAEVSLRDVLRQANSGDPIDDNALKALRKAASLTTAQNGSASSTELQALSAIENQLLHVIGQAVRRKKEKHAGIGELEHIKNRPMILIGG